MPLRVVLAGHNLDRDLLEELKALLRDLAVEGGPIPPDLSRRAREILGRDNWTPETLAAAYARVSRDPQSLPDLRAAARSQVEKARRSNESIVFGLGHSSVAEHAVFNLDILGLSRLAVEVVERQRLSSYTEKSQRYILLEEDWVLPEEVRGGPAEALFRETLAAQNRFYHDAFGRLLPLVLAKHPAEAADRVQRRMLEGLAKEDARYGLSLATTVQLGETINARNLESLIAHCRAHPLRELHDLAGLLQRAAGGLAPSLIKYLEPSPYLREARSALREEARSLPTATGMAAAPGAGAPAAPAGRPAEGTLPGPVVRLVSTTPDPDAVLVAALLFAGGFGNMGACTEMARTMDPAGRRRIVVSQLRHLGVHDPLLREYEHVDLVFELVISASCFAQLKRHRMSTLTPLDYDPSLGLTVPGSFDEAGLTGSFRELASQSEECSGRIRALAPAAAAYPLLNAHRRRVLWKLNARELHHVARLREDAHAQWDIRRTAEVMIELARERMPLTLLLAAGKDRFDEQRGRALGDV